MSAKPIGHEGYANRDMISLDENLSKIRDINPDVGRQVTDMIADIPPAQVVYDFYPELKGYAADAFDQLQEFTKRQAGGQTGVSDVSTPVPLEGE